MMIVEISEGITEAKGALEGKDVLVNPDRVREKNKVIIIDAKDGERIAQELHFEVYVNSTNSSDLKEGISVFGGFIGIGAASTNAENIVSGNLIKFSIPVSFPVTGVEKEPSRYGIK